MTDHYIYQSMFAVISLYLCRWGQQLWKRRSTLPTIEARLDRESLALKLGAVALYMTWAK